MLTNQPDSLGKVVAFQERPYNFTIQMPDGYVIDEPVTVEIWTYESMVDDTTPVTIDGQNILFTFTIEQLREFAETRIFIVFDGDKKLGANVTVTMDPSYPSETSVEVVMSDGSGIVKVSIWSDRENALLAQQAAADAEAAVTAAEAAADAAAASAAEAASAAAGAQSTYYSWGTWNADTNTPTLSSTPLSLVVGGKYPQVTVTTPGELDIPVEGYTIGQVLPVGFLYGQPPKSGFPSGYWSFISADSAATLQFQKNHVKFQIGPVTNFDIVQNDTDVTVTILATVTIFDEIFGFRVINPTTITVANNEILVLSGLAGSYTSPGLDVKGTGQEVFMRTVPFNTLSNPLNGLAEIASVQQFVWNPRFTSLQARSFEKSNAWFTLGPTDAISIFEDTLTTTVSITAAVTVRDQLSGYRSLGVQSIVVGNNETLVLSASNSSYVDPQLYVKGTGQSLFLSKYPLSTLNRALKGAAILGNVSSFKWVTNISSMQDKTPVNALKTRATNLESFQVRRSEVYIGPKSSLNISSQDGGTTYKVSVLSSLSIRDERSGFWTIPVQSITMTNNQVLCLALNAYPAAYVDPGFNTTKGTGGTINFYKYNLNELSSKFTGTIVLGMLVNGVWIGQHPSFTGDYIDRMTDLAAKGLVPQITSAVNAKAQEYLAPIAKLMRVKDRDVVVKWINGSVDTDFYCTQRPDWLYRFPGTSDYSFISSVADDLMKHWSMQKLRLPGSMAEGFGGATPFFTESATTAADKYYDPDWDLVYVSPPAQTAQRIFTRKLEGAVVSVSYNFPNGEQSSHFMHRTGSTHSALIRIKIGDGSAGNNGKIQVLDETDNTWKEANGHPWSQQASATVHPAWGSATGLKESIVQKRLKMRRTPGQATFLTYTVTHTTEDGKPLCYNGVSYSSKTYQLIFVNESKGSHGINELKAYTWRDAYWKEHLTWYGANTINMLPVYTSSFSPINFGQVFVDYVNEILATVFTRTEGSFTETFSPKVMMTVDFCSRTQQLYSTTDTTPYNVFTGFGTASLRDFIDMMVQMVTEECEIPVSNAFPVFLEMADRWAIFTGDTRYRIAHQYFGATSNSFVTDNTHPNDLGNRIKIGAHSSYVNALR